MADAMTDKMIGRKEGFVGQLIFNNPERRNAVSREMWEAIGPILDEFELDPAIRVIVVSGAGEKAFVSGADISEFDKYRDSRADFLAKGSAGDTARDRLRQCGKPLIAMIRGYCLGGGMNVAIACDLRIAADNAQFGIPAARLGNGYGEAGLRPLVNLIGPAMAKEMMFTAKRYSAEEARGMGLVNHVVPSAELECVVQRYAQIIADNAPLTIASSKRVIDALGKANNQRDLSDANELVLECLDSADFKEGRAAFREKRRPVFSGS